MKFYIVFLSSIIFSEAALTQRQTTDIYGLFRPWTQTLASNTQNMGQQFAQLLGSSFDRFNQLGDQITASIGSRIEQMENQIHDLAKEIRLTIYNNNLRLNNTLTKRTDN